MNALSALARPSTVAAAGLLGGFAAARYSGRREVGGAVFTLAGAYCGPKWKKSAGPVGAVAMSTLYSAAMGGSHPLAKKIGAWPSVLAVTAATVVASEVVTRKGS